MNKTNIAVIGSTGFLGRQALDVISSLRDKFQVFALTCAQNAKLLVRQAKKFKPRYLATINPEASRSLKKDFNLKGVKIGWGNEILSEIVSHPEVDFTLFLASGTETLKALLLGIKKKKRIAIASKELIVAFGEHIFDLAQKAETELLPVDSELVALHQLFHSVKNQSREIKRVIITSSGGPFFRPQKLPSDITVEKVLGHPVWQMGRKITVDSATLMNKGFEMIEAMRFFGLPLSKIEILIHPQAIVHSLVEFSDSVTFAMMSKPDMRIFIQYALSFPKSYKLAKKFAEPIFSKDNQSLSFYQPDDNRFPALKLCRAVAKEGGSLPCVLVSADEVAVEAFLNQKIKFGQIIKVVEETLLNHTKIQNPTLAELIQVEKWAKNFAQRLIDKL